MPSRSEWARPKITQLHLKLEIDERVFALRPHEKYRKHKQRGHEARACPGYPARKNPGAGRLPDQESRHKKDKYMISCIKDSRDRVAGIGRVAVSGEARDIGQGLRQGPCAEEDPTDADDG